MSKYRVYVGSVQQETNSFSPARSDLSDFDTATGAEVLSRLAVEPLVRPDVTLVPGFYANAVPSGTMKREVFGELLNNLLAGMDAPLDGAFLYLHGALDVEGLGSGDAEIARAVRARLGPKVKLAIAMDFHANVSPVLLREADVVLAYRTAPHVDMEDTQRRACRALLYLMEHGEHPAGCMVRIPMLFTGDCVITDNLPAKGLMHLLEELEARPGVIALSICFGQPWVDTRWVGPCALAYAEDITAARDAALALATAWWEARRDFKFLTETCPPERAFSLALSSPASPVFLSDSGDNTTAGAAGDRAGMLRRAVESGGEGILIAGLTDAPAVAACRAGGPDAKLYLTLGGTLDTSHGDLFKGEFTVVSVGGILGWYGEDAGGCAVVRIGGVDVILTENRCAVTSPEIVASAGLSIYNYRAVVVKLGYLYPKLAAVAPRAVFVTTDGASTANVSRIPYRAMTGPFFPRDPDMAFDPAAHTFEKGALA